MIWFFLFFSISGFCSILYEIVWLRLAMAQFGVTSALVSIVLSMFMAGLGLGSWLSGHLIRKYGESSSTPALRLYALTELLIGTSALLVPQELLWGRHLLEHAGFSSSIAYYLASGAWVALTLIPWCACMGATIPIAMLAIRRSFQRESSRSFSYLYLSNVSGAVVGALVPPLLIELHGFHWTLKVGAVLNGVLAVSAIVLSRTQPVAQRAATEAERLPSAPSKTGSRSTLALLFTTGLTSMGMEVVWIRQFTPYLGTMVYAFAAILGLYLAATFIGSRFYRLWSRTHRYEVQLTWACLGLFALLPLITADPRLDLHPALRLILGVAPFSGVLGFVTPMLVDRWSGGDPDHAGTAYAVNILGCILGPLLAGFGLLPLASEHWVLTLFAVPWLMLGAWPRWSSEPSDQAIPRRSLAPYAVLALAVVCVVLTRDFQVVYPNSRVLRDNTATVIATGEGMQKRLLVNGIGMTGLSPVTKIMAHLPLAFLDHPPHNALAICFGMGTSYRSLLSWGIPATAVELVPSVPKMFSYFHTDAQDILSSPLSHVVVDDGRRYLERSTEQYDVVTIDPPPPVEAAGSSLLYTKEFYTIIKGRLRSGGILQQWLPDGDDEVRAAVTRALVESFPYVRVFAYRQTWGYHFLASSQPIPQRSAEQLIQRMPAAAIRDMQEWSPPAGPERIFALVLSLEKTPEQVIAVSPQTPAMQDDRPVNEYFLLRSLRRGNNVTISAQLPTP
ncbi:MAG: fused MFS/spermidine synthase [Acidobacteriia bacterium]|nr:fused MFS/spermidine synthase [Terriglobia bacterium]